MRPGERPLDLVRDCGDVSPFDCLADERPEAASGFLDPARMACFWTKAQQHKNAFTDLSGLLPSNAQMAPYLSGWSGKESGSAASEHTGTAHA